MVGAPVKDLVSDPTKVLDLSYFGIGEEPRVAKKPNGFKNRAGTWSRAADPETLALCESAEAAFDADPARGRVGGPKCVSSTPPSPPPRGQTIARRARARQGRRQVSERGVGTRSSGAVDRRGQRRAVRVEGSGRYSATSSSKVRPAGGSRGGPILDNGDDL
jgi:hypothetical protein